ncbi:MAG: L-lysine 6-transaminase, partial [Candidatus Dadabacteria bacterium]|nr:L-lysine 6-transaminase [Candidatus Dadabacteria bacterium]
GFDYIADLKKSHGSWFVDARTGREYLDCYSLHASQPLGWNHPKLKDYKKQLSDVVFHNISNSDLYSEPYDNFVTAFSKIAPDFSHFFFISGGTLGVENALKAAFDWKAQKLEWDDYHDDSDIEDQLDVIHLNEAFHGRSGYTLSLTNTGITKTKWYPKFKWTRILNPKITEGVNVSALEAFSLDQAENALRTNKVAAIVLETIQGEGGDNHFRPGFFQALRNLADRYEAMLILDEVQTGVGMTGKMWAYEHYGIIPDMICFGKKTQVCGFCSTNRIDEVPNNVFKASGRINSTWGGNLVDMVRANIYFKIIEEDNLVNNAKEVGAYFLRKLSELPLKNVRGQGLMLAFDLSDSTERDEFLAKLNERVFCLKSGEKSIRFRPHLTFTKDDVDVAVNAVRNLI